MLELKISKGTNTSVEIEIIDVVWKGLRCSLHIEGEYNNLFLDIRTQPANSSSSIALTKKPFKANGISSVVVEDENLQSSSAKLVIIDEEDNIFYQLDTIIGGNND